jgi:Uma2 family endonuclease
MMQAHFPANVARAKVLADPANPCYPSAMNVALRKPMTREAFFAWAEAQDVRHEFDGFQPVAMTGGNMGHSRIISNINRHLANRLAGKRCESVGPEVGIATVGQAVRYPDALVTCSGVGDHARLVPDPVIVFEVVSPTSVHMDHVVKLQEYQAVPTIRHYIIVESAAAAVTLHVRDQDSVAFESAKLTCSDTIRLPEIGIEIPVASIYERTAFASENRESP